MEPEHLIYSDWTVPQLEAAVAAFAEMSERIGQGEAVIRRLYYRELAGRHPRGASAFKASFYYISYALDRLGMHGVPGAATTAPVGQETEQVLRQAILRTPYFRQFRAAQTPGPASAPPRGRRHPRTYQETVTRHERNGKLAEWIVDQANGHCENCGLPAPFTKANGEPYLEAHHVKWLSQHGSDMDTNMVALCPNCHRRFHHGADAAQLAADIIRRVGRLVAE